MAVSLAEAFIRLRPEMGPNGREFKAETKRNLDGAGLDREGSKHGKAFGGAFVRSSVGPFRGFAGAVGGPLVAAFAVIKGAQVFGGFIRDAEESARVARVTANVIKSTGGAAKVTATQVGNLATAISNKTGKDDEAIQAGQNMLLTFTNVRNEAGKNNDIFNQASSILTDMTAAMNGGEVTSQGMTKQAIQLGKALNDPIAGMGALRRVGVTFTDQQKKQITALVQSGDKLGAQKIILKELGKEFGGTAAASSSALDRMKVTLGNVGETIGGVLLPAVNGAANFLSSKFAPAVSAVVTSLSTGKNSASGFAGRLGAMAVTVRGVALPALQAVGNFLTTQVVPALRSFGGHLATTVIPPLLRFGGYVRSTVLPAVGALYRDLFTRLAPAFAAIGNFITARVLPAFAGLMARIRDNRAAFEAVGRLIAAFYRLAASIIGTVVPIILRLVGPIFTLLFAAIGKLIGIFGAVVRAAVSFGRFVVGAFQRVAAVVGPVVSVIRAVWGALFAVMTIPIKLAVIIIGGLLLGVVHFFQRHTAALRVIWAVMRTILIGPVQLAYNVITGLFGRLRTVVGGAVGFFVSVFRGSWRSIANFVLGAIDNMLGALRHMVSAFSHLPGPLGAPFRHARDKIDEARNAVHQLQAKINATHGKTISVIVRGKVVSFPEVGARWTGLGPLGHARTGGEITGPGGPTADRAGLYALSNKEWVIRAQAAGALGPKVMAAINHADRLGWDGASLLDALEGKRAVGMAAGGVATAQSWIHAQRGKPYVWGGVGPGSYDCSGFTGGVYGILKGQSPYRRYMTTSSNFPALGFSRGRGMYTVGLRPGHHIVGNLGGLAFEAAHPGTTMRIGGSATPVTSMPQLWHMTSMGGGVGLTPHQMIQIANMALRIHAAVVGAGIKSVIPRGAGGPLLPGHDYLVGEAGAELLHMGSGRRGRATPAGAKTENHFHFDGAFIASRAQAKDLFTEILDDLHRGGRWS